MKKILNGWWEKISNLGISRYAEIGDKIRIRLTNQMIVLFCSLSLLYGILFFLLEYYFFAVDLFIVFFLGIIPLTANKYHFYNIAKFYTIVISNFQIALFYYGFGKDSAILFVHFPILALPILLFRIDQKQKMVAGFLITAASAGVSEIIADGAHVQVSDLALRIIYYSILLLLIVIQIAVLLYFSYNQHFYEQQLVSQHNKLQKFSNDLIRKNEKLFQVQENLRNSEEELRVINSNLESIVHIRTGELEEALSEQKQLRNELDEIMNAMPIIIWVSNSDGEIHYFNQTWFEYTGRTLSETEGKGWENTIHPEDLPLLLQQAEISRNNLLPFNLAYRIRNREGVYRWHQGFAFPVGQDDIKMIKWIGTAVDIHDQKIYNQQLSEKNLELTRINNNLDTFVYTASHDLKVPVANLEGLLMALTETFSIQTKQNPETNNLMSMIEASVHKLKRTIEDLTLIGKVHKNLNTDYEEIEIETEVIEIKENLGPAVLKPEIKFSLKTLKCKTIYFSKTNFRTILFNLISNSIKYRHKDRPVEIEISCLQTAEYFLLRVKDNGIGIPDDQIGKIFGLFKRVHTHVEGTGVGLYLVKSIIENAGGRIEAESEENEGTIFTVYFPLLH
jgi:PAS domain S-box-containing protein